MFVLTIKHPHESLQIHWVGHIKAVVLILAKSTEHCRMVLTLLILLAVTSTAISELDWVSIKLAAAVNTCKSIVLKLYNYSVHYLLQEVPIGKEHLKRIFGKEAFDNGV